MEISTKHMAEISFHVAEILSSRENMGLVLFSSPYRKPATDCTSEGGVTHSMKPNQKVVVEG